MPYESVDALQRALATDVFKYTRDAKKASGRALGTFVEIITFYLLKGWGYEKNTAIERSLPEYANKDITHNVEFTLHPSFEIASVSLPTKFLPFTTKKITTQITDVDWTVCDLKKTQLLTSKEILRNACLLYEDYNKLIIAYLGVAAKEIFQISINELKPHPFAVFECKRVGVEEGVKKGPQTIEKAKQGAYVARTVSSLQKIRLSDGSVYGVLHLDSGKLRFEPYEKFLKLVVESDDPGMLRNFILTVGVVSNHGNWFTSDDHNKELKVLAQSYDWLLFLTDPGLSTFVSDLLIKPTKRYKPIKDAFLRSYTGKRGGNIFTKVTIDLKADFALRYYFQKNLSNIEGWFNIISPVDRTIDDLKNILHMLSSKNWKEILS